MTTQSLEKFPADLARFLGLMQNLAEQALSLGKPDQFWPLMAGELTKFFRCDRVTLFQQGKDKLVSCYAVGVTEPIVVADGEGIAGWAAQTRRSCLTNDPYADPRFSARADVAAKYKTTSLLAVPLTAHGRAVGVVELLNKPGGFTEADQKAMEFLGSQIATYFLLFSIGERQDALTLQMLQMEKMAAVGRLVAGFTHEVRNPLMVIMGFADKLMHDLEKQPALAEDAGRIKASAKRIENLVKNLLSFSRVSRNTTGPVDLCALIETTLELVVVDTKWQKMTIEKDFDRATPVINGNVNTLMQVFLNLIMNALQAMEAGGGKKLVLRVKKGEGGGAIAEVADEGPGMPPEVQEKIFEPFFTTKGKDGTGLGLYIVSGIIESHKGRIAVTSAPGKGTTFTLTFPGGV